MSVTAPNRAAGVPLHPLTTPAAVPAPVERPMTVFTAQVVETRGMLARIAVLLNPYDVRTISLCLERCELRIVVEGNGFDAGRVAARLDKVIGVLDVTHS